MAYGRYFSVLVATFLVALAANGASVTAPPTGPEDTPDTAERHGRPPGLVAAAVTTVTAAQREEARDTAPSAVPADGGTDTGRRETNLMSFVVPIVVAAVLLLAVAYFLFWGRWHDRRGRMRMAALRGVSAADLATSSLDDSGGNATGAAEAGPRRERRRRGLNLTGGLGRSESGRSIRTLPEYTKEAGDEERVLLRRDPSLTLRTASHGQGASSPTHARRLSELSGLSVVTESGEAEVANAPLSWGAAPSYDLGYQYGYGDAYDPPNSPPPSGVFAAHTSSRSPPTSAAQATLPSSLAAQAPSPPTQQPPPSTRSAPASPSAPPRHAPLHASTPPPARSASYAASSRTPNIASRLVPPRAASVPPPRLPPMSGPADRAEGEVDDGAAAPSVTPAAGAVVKPPNTEEGGADGNAPAAAPSPTQALASPPSPVPTPAATSSPTPTLPPTLPPLSTSSSSAWSTFRSLTP